MDAVDSGRADATMLASRSEAVRNVLMQVDDVARTDATVLLVGETGSGKEVFADRIHQLSGRRGREMVRVNCAAIPATLIESELFGREKGAFTDAVQRKSGRFEMANDSTIFLDEIGDVSLDIQVKLLRVLEDRQIHRLGSPEAIPVNVRVVAATHRDLQERVASELFREDLFYRLNVFPIRVPPLREHPEDIPVLVAHFVAHYAIALRKSIDVISAESMTMLQKYAWPGNIRELRNAVERAMILATGPRLTISPPAVSVGSAAQSWKLADVQKNHIRFVLESVGWRIRGAGGAAEQLGLRPTTLETRMVKLGLVRPRPAA